MNKDEIVVDVFRWDPSVEDAPRMKTYRVAADQPQRVLDLLQMIYEQHDPTLAFRPQRCNQGICNGCRVRLSAGGRAVKSCQTLIEPGQKVSVYPADFEGVIRDLVTD